MLLKGSGSLNLFLHYCLGIWPLRLLSGKNCAIEEGIFQKPIKQSLVFISECMWQDFRRDIFKGQMVNQKLLRAYAT